MPDDLAALRSHIGTKITEHDTATAAPIRSLLATFGRAGTEASPEPGVAIPPGWIMGYFLPNYGEAELAPDGMPTDAGVVPPMPFPRRMAAGATLRLHRPIRIGDALTRETELTDVTIKQGSTGRLGFTTVVHRIFGPEGLAVEEERGLAFREAVPEGAANPAPRRDPPPDDTIWEATVHPTAMTLFRYSAVTFNTHRIHYDHPWATGAEGYPTLVVHGPLTMTYLMNFARDCNPGRTVTSFTMRARAPLFVDAPLRMVGKPTGPNGCEVWAVTPEGTIGQNVGVTFA